MAKYYSDNTFSSTNYCTDVIKYQVSIKINWYNYCIFNSANEDGCICYHWYLSLQGYLKKLTRFEENYVKDWSKDEFNVILDT